MMNYTKNIINIFLKLIIVFTLMFLFGVSYAYAQTQPPLGVDFETNPLFSETNILPGDGVSKTVTVTNNSKESQSVITEAVNAIDGDGLGDMLNIVVAEGANELYSDTLGNFLRVGATPLSVLESGGTAVYSFTVSFIDGADDTTQSGTLDFDLCIGFEGGESNCGDTEISGEGGTNDGGSGGGSGDGGSGGGTVLGGGSGSGGGGTGVGGGGILNTKRLKIENERTTNVSVDEGATESTATIEWDTNLLSTSQVIYGPATNGIGGPELFYSLNLTVLPYFGYPSATVQDSIKVTKHTVVLTGLVPNQVYKYRVISRASPPTVSYEHTFVAKTQTVAINFPTSPTGGGSTPSPRKTETEILGTGGGFIAEDGALPEDGAIGGTLDSNSGGTVVGVGTGDTGDAKDDQGALKKDDTTNGNLAASLFAFSDFSLQCALYLLLILFIIALLHRLWNRYLRKGIILNPNEVVTKAGLIFWIGGILSAILIIYLMSYLCVIAPLTALASVLFVWYLIKLY